MPGDAPAAAAQRRHSDTTTMAGPEPLRQVPAAARALVAVILVLWSGQPLLAQTPSPAASAASQTAAPTTAKPAPATAKPAALTKDDIAFRLWLEDLWPEAKALGIERAIFDAAFKDVTPDISLPDLVRPGEKPKPGKGQAEFSKTPEQYLNQRYLLRLAGDGRALLAQHAATLKAVEQSYGVPPAVVLAIWGRETAFGRYTLPHYAIKALATQAYLGRRKDMFRKELLYALKMLQDRFATLADMRSSWAGALGLTQFMPTEYYSTAVDMDQDGRRDIWRSVPDALGSAARQLKAKGWLAGQSWAYEVVLPPGATCALEGPKQARSLGEWEKLGLKRTQGRTFTPELQSVSAYLMMPAGGNGPAFLATENFTVIKRYNPSDLYAVFVGNLSDRIAGGGDFATKWAPIKQLPRAEIAEIQERLKAAGYAIGKIDGLIGSNTRAQIGAYQQRNRLRTDCWPSAAVLTHLRRLAAR